MNQATILKKILDRKAEEVSERQALNSLADLEAQMQTASPCRGFTQALMERINHKRPAVIAEIKKASPGRGVLRAAVRSGGHCRQLCSGVAPPACRC